MDRSVGGMQAECGSWDAFPADLLAEVLRKFPHSDAKSIRSVHQTCKCDHICLLDGSGSDPSAIWTVFHSGCWSLALVMGGSSMQYLTDSDEPPLITSLNAFEIGPKIALDRSSALQLIYIFRKG